MKKGIDYIGVGVSAMIFNSESEVLLSRRGQKARDEQGKWEFPGGGIEYGELIIDALKREAKEECDIEIEVVDILEVADFIPKDEPCHWVCPAYIAKHISGEARIMEPEKCDELKWMKLSEINIDQLTITSRSNLEKYIEKYGYNSTAE